LSRAIRSRGEAVKRPIVVAPLARRSQWRARRMTTRPIGPELYCATAMVLSGLSLKPSALIHGVQRQGLFHRETRRT
jgi:tRNA-dihydrouridine synthase